MPPPPNLQESVGDSKDDFETIGVVSRGLADEHGNDHEDHAEPRPLAQAFFVSFFNTKEGGGVIHYTGKPLPYTFTICNENNRKSPPKFTIK